MGFLKKLRDLYNYYKYLEYKSKINGVYYDDVAFLHLWNKGTDYNYIKREYRLIAAGLYGANNIVDKIIRCYNDQKTGTYFHNRLRLFEPQQLSKAGDLVVKEGLIHFSKLHVGQTGSLPDYGELGIGGQAAAGGDFALTEAVETRLHLLNDGGFRELIGADEHYGVIWPFNVATNNYSESGLFVGRSASLGDTMICHNVYSPSIQHTQNDNAPGMNIIIKHRAYR